MDGRIALPANQREVPQNCAVTIIVRTRLRFALFKVFDKGGFSFVIADG